MEVKFRADGMVVTGDPHEIARFIGQFFREFRSEMGPILAKQIVALQVNAPPPPGTAPPSLGDKSTPTIEQWRARVHSVSTADIEKWLSDHPHAKVGDFAVQFLGGPIEFRGPMQAVYTTIYNRLAHTRWRMKGKPQKTSQ